MSLFQNKYVDDQAPLKLKNQNIKYMKIIDNLIKIEFKNKDLIKIDHIISSTKNMDLKIFPNRWETLYLCLPCPIMLRVHVKQLKTEMMVLH